MQAPHPQTEQGKTLNGFSKIMVSLNVANNEHKTGISIAVEELTLHCHGKERTWSTVYPCRGFPKVGVPFGGPHNKEYSVWGSS